MAEDSCTTIVAYEVNGEDCDKFLNAWKEANDYLKNQKGHTSTTLHQSASANPDFRFVNVSCWDSAEAFRLATQSEDFREASAKLEAYPIHASVYEVVET
ncbi:MAG: antibiotic biosynthesis monooxygenase family protein [Acidimicrobiales bacterium]